MFKRARWTTVGYVAGLGTSFAVARKVRRQAARLAPPEVARRSSERVRSAIEDGRVAMQAREAELRRAYDPQSGGPRPVADDARPARPLRSVPNT